MINFMPYHKAKKLFGCDMWDQISHEHHCPLLPGFFDCKEHSYYIYSNHLNITHVEIKVHVI